MRGYNLGQNKMEQQTPIPPPAQIKDKASRRAKMRHFPIFDFGGRGGGVYFEFSIFFVQDCNLGQNKIEQLTPIPPISRMKPCEAQKRAFFPSLILGGGGRGSSFSIYFVRDCGILHVREERRASWMYGTHGSDTRKGSSQVSLWHHVCLLL